MILRPPPKNFGYFAGDVLVVRAEIVTGLDDALDPLSLPVPGPLDAATELRDIAVEEARQDGERRTTITITYQTFLATERVTQAFLPGYSMKFRNGSKIFQAHVPEYLFHVSPIRVAARLEDEAADLKPNQGVPMVQGRAAEMRLLTACATMFFAALALAGFWGLLPGLARNAPFARASQHIARLARAGEMPGAASRELHRAFDAVLGRRMLAEDVAEFLVAWPAYMKLKGEIIKFFADSQNHFFARGGSEERAWEVLHLARNLRRIERKW